MTPLRKTVHVNDLLVGQASTWDEVYALLRAKGIWFLGKPGAAEGPTGFYLHGTATTHVHQRGRSGNDVA
jgi:hypothetical protein